MQTGKTTVGDPRDVAPARAAVTPRVVEPAVTTSHRNADFADLRQQAGILRLLALLLAGLGVAAGCQGGLGWLGAVAAALLAVGCWQVADHRSALSARAAQAAQDIETLIRRRVGQ